MEENTRTVNRCVESIESNISNIHHEISYGVFIKINCELSNITSELSNIHGTVASISEDTNLIREDVCSIEINTSK